MSTFPNEPGDAASSASQRLDLNQQDAGQHSISRRSVPPRSNRTASSSLLSQLLAPTPELDETTASTHIEQEPGVSATSQTTTHGTIDGIDSRAQSGRQTAKTEILQKHTNVLQEQKDISNKGLPRNSDRNSESRTGGQSTAQIDAMATAATMPASVLSLGPSPMSTSPRVDLADMTHVNDMLNSHRDFLRQYRGRGTSLERTQKERRVQTMPLENASTNPGDTGMTRPSTPLNPADLIAKEESPMDGVRARYRSWRDARPGTIATEKAWSIGNSTGGEELGEGQVEKSIADALAGIEPNSRSRKASHSLRFFKEGLPEEPKRKDKDRGRSKDQSQRFKEAVGNGIETFDGASKNIDEGASQYTPFRDGFDLSRTISGTSVTSITSPNKSPTKQSVENAAQNSNSSAGTSTPPRKMPQQLLDDLRRRHNLIPSTRDSFSPTKSTFGKGSDHSYDSASTEDQLRDQSYGARTGDDAIDNESPSCQSRNDDEDSSEEKISSALFVPHQASRTAKLHDHERSMSDLAAMASGQRDVSLEPDVPAEDWLVKHELPAEDDGTEPSSSNSLPPALVDDKVDTDAEYFPAPQTPSEFGDSQSETDYMSRGYETGTDAEDTTPTGTLKLESHMTQDSRDHLHAHQNDTTPPAAIELIPYKHQVGGHTTMWRFSKRAVCKQLNNRENAFYEKIEKNHPKLLAFMPKYVYSRFLLMPCTMFCRAAVLTYFRYIGVLNVTFEKSKKQPKENIEPTDQASATTLLRPDHKPGLGSRMISQSMASSAPEIAPSVTIADNRHIIPKSFLPSIAAHSHATTRSQSDESILAVQRSQSQPPLPAFSSSLRPRLDVKHANSWGATSVNRALRYEVFGEAFGQSIPVQKHKKPSQRSIPHRPGTGSKLRNSNSDSDLTAILGGQCPEESIRKKALKSAAERVSTTNVVAADSRDIPTTDDGSSAQFDDQAGTSAPDPDVKAPELERQKVKKRRRYSSGALRRKPDEVADGRGDLKYFEEADDVGYTGDGEDDVFAMDLGPAATSDGADQQEKIGNASTVISNNLRAKTMPVTQEEDFSSSANILTMEPRPVNPNVARTGVDKRVEFFLLLEDLTAGMKRPSVMDLKMGTRQYGVDADAKKQKSQRRKCAETTSKELGVRVCGLQAWDVGKQTYIFQDKYFGRDLKAGKPFRDALVRFLYDGVSYDSILRHIPGILTKLSKLEARIKGLNGYRFYAASLLLFYDAEGAQDGKGPSEIDFKMADFANCITPETDLQSRLCPPQHANSPDLGFLKGLRSLRAYFTAIQKWVAAGGILDEAGSDSGDENVIFDVDRFMEFDDLGEVSY